MSSSKQNLNLQQPEQSEHLIENNDNDNNNDDNNKYKRRTCCWFFCGFILLILVIQLTFVPHLITVTIKNNIEDAFIFNKPEPDNSHYQTWITNSDAGSVPIMFSIQFFNVTNPDEVLLGAMPKLTLVGPLVYNQYFWRQNVNFSKDGEWVNQTFYTQYLWNQKLSKINPHEKLTVFSPLVGTLYHQWNTSKIITREAMQEIMKLFEDDPNLLFWRDKQASDLIWSIYKFEHFGFNFEWGFMRNESNQYYILNTGYKNPSRMGEVSRWCRSPLNMSCLNNDSTQYISVWDPPMPLSPGHLFYAGVYTLTDMDNKNDIPPLWIDILFRNIYLQYNKTYNFKGIELYKYGIQLEPQLSNITQYPPNAQFNQFGPSGVLNSTAAYDNILIFLSMVLFYGAPDYLKNNSKLGIPNPGPYDYPFIDIEPRTGAVFYANASMQICTPIYSLPNINNKTIEKGEKNLFNLTNDVMIPIYLVTFSDELTDDIANNFKSNIDLGHNLHKASVIIGWIAVAFLIIWSFITTFAGGIYYVGLKMRNIN